MISQIPYYMKFLQHNFNNFSYILEHKSLNFHDLTETETYLTDTVPMFD